MRDYVMCFMRIFPHETAPTLDVYRDRTFLGLTSRTSSGSITLECRAPFMVDRGVKGDKTFTSMLDLCISAAVTNDMRSKWVCEAFGLQF